MHSVNIVANVQTNVKPNTPPPPPTPPYRKAFSCLVFTINSINCY